MHQLKKSVGFIALFFGVLLALAFKAPEAKQESVSEVKWFSYNGMGQTDPSNYTELPGEPECDAEGSLCAIQALEDGDTGKPIQAEVISPRDTREFL